ncbi:UMP kinase [Bauldia litoralis]|uniref:Uridylate kinase n=1 Tax=Bauldia litoralis TaxID=665467 RepID=A0A1G6AWZ0_9HYPH|nr:UMP kinase [Bauldia litoralis]SDB12881.1 uridylate kinase [Bauldia litoralis]
MTGRPLYEKVLLKLSGEVLAGDGGTGIDRAVVERLSDEIAEASRRGVKVGVVAGGGNFLRGAAFAGEGGDRVAGDQMGMLGTIMNAIAFREALTRRGIAARVFSAVPVPTICETFTQRDADRAFEAGEVLLFAGGTGNPFFTTDTGAALRAAEMGCDALFKGTQVDGIYSADPKLDPDAVRFDRMTHEEVLAKGLEVMDAAAVSLARDNGIPVIVFSILQPGAIVAILDGKGKSTIVTDT